MQLSDTNAQVRDAARAFAEDVIRPVAGELDAPRSTLKCNT